jgi:hypothetical protein
LWWSGREAGLFEQRPKTVKGKPISDLRQPRGLLNGQTGSPTGRDNLLFSRNDEEVRFVADEGDEVRTTVCHRSVWQQVGPEEPFV